MLGVGIGGTKERMAALEVVLLLGTRRTNLRTLMTSLMAWTATSYSLSNVISTIRSCTHHNSLSLHTVTAHMSLHSHNTPLSLHTQHACVTIQYRNTCHYTQHICITTSMIHCHCTHKTPVTTYSTCNHNTPFSVTTNSPHMSVHNTPSYHHTTIKQSTLIYPTHAHNHLHINTVTTPLPMPPHPN